jgi:deoxyadenosine/deoxycytidine kinase
MVGDLELISIDNREKSTKPRIIVELVGPAGAGKTTLAAELIQRNIRIQLGTPPYFREIKHFPFFTKNILSLLPIILYTYHDNHHRQLSLREIVWMATLNGWQRILVQQASRNDASIILDQGPVYLLTELYVFGPNCLKDQNVKKWWDTTFKRWASTLDLIVWLDTSDHTLIERIHTRGKWHLMKGQKEVEIIKFLAEYREAYENVISLLMSYNPHLKIIRINTGLEMLELVLDKLLIDFD